MRLSPAILFPALLALAGCERLAGTEVGNPEVTVAARFSVQDDDDSAKVGSLNLKVMGMGYSMPGDSGACWNKGEGTMVDFMVPGGRGLPDAKVEGGAWTKAEMILHTPAGPEALPDTGDVGAWSNPRYAKLYLMAGGDTLPALFDMPQGLEIKLMWGKERVDAWRANDTVWVPITLDARGWAGNLPSSAAWKTRQDGKHARYVLFSATENAAGWNELKARLPEALSADSVATR